jgi:hypothetical protein
MTKTAILIDAALLLLLIGVIVHQVLVIVHQVLVIGLPW